MRITDFCEERMPADASARRSCPRVNPAIPRDPILRKLRRSNLCGMCCRLDRPVILLLRQNEDEGMSRRDISWQASLSSNYSILRLHSPRLKLVIQELPGAPPGAACRSRPPAGASVRLLITLSTTCRVSTGSACGREGRLCGREGRLCGREGRKGGGE